jgi:hypothetical protein
MSIEFAIIPVVQQFEEQAYVIKNKIQSAVKLNTSIEVDTEYSSPLTSRISIWKKKEYDIITIDQDFIENNSIVVRFSDKGSRPKTMELEEFIDLVVSFEDDEDPQPKDESTNDDNNDVGGCTIM